MQAKGGRTLRAFPNECGMGARVSVQVPSRQSLKNKISVVTTASQMWNWLNSKGQFLKGSLSEGSGSSIVVMGMGDVKQWERGLIIFLFLLLLFKREISFFCGIFQTSHWASGTVMLQGLLSPDSLLPRLLMRACPSRAGAQALLAVLGIWRLCIGLSRPWCPALLINNRVQRKALEPAPQLLLVLWLREKSLSYYSPAP